MKKQHPRLRVDDVGVNQYVTETLRKRLHRQSRPFRAMAKRWSRRGNVYGIRMVGTPVNAGLVFSELFDARGRLLCDLAPPKIRVLRAPALDKKRSTGTFLRNFESWRPQLRGAIRESRSRMPREHPLFRVHQAIYQNGVIETGLLSMAGIHMQGKDKAGPPVPLNAGQAVDAMALLIAWIASAREQLPVRSQDYLIEVELVAINRHSGTPATVRLAPANTTPLPLAPRSVRFPRYYFPVLFGLGDFGPMTLLATFERDLYHYCGLPLPSQGQFELETRPAAGVVRAA